MEMEKTVRNDANMYMNTFYLLVNFRVKVLEITIFINLVLRLKDGAILLILEKILILIFGKVLRV